MVQRKLLPKYRVSARLSKYIQIGEVYETDDFEDACSKAVVYETKYCLLTNNYDIKVKIDVVE